MIFPYKKTLKNLYQLKRLAAQFASQLAVGNLILLSGPLGVGKTTFSKNLIQQLLQNNISITSPTFNLIKIYQNNSLKVCHCDLFLLNNLSKSDLFFQIFEGIDFSITIIEWPELFLEFLQKKSLQIKYFYVKIDFDNLNNRVFNIQACHEKLLHK